MTQNSGFYNERMAKLLVDLFIRQGVNQFCLSPGSRSTPLALAVSQHPEAKVTVHFDERGMAFHALGIAKATRKPAVIIVTSGTAVGNILPAVMEAAHSDIPLILLTADRPPELRECGANQTLDQVKIFSSFVKWEIDLPCPGPEIPDTYLATTLSHALFRSMQAPKGVVHLNCMFREPLFSAAPIQITQLQATCYEHSDLHPSKTTLEYWGDLLSEREKGIIVLGRVADLQDPSPIYELAEKLGWPVIGDLLSGARSHEKGENFIAYQDLILKTVSDLKVDTVLHFGERLVSKTLLEWLSSCKPSRYFLVANTHERHDPKHLLTHRLDACPFLFTKLLLPYVEKRSKNSWIMHWKTEEKRTRKKLPDIFAEQKEITEPGIAYALSSSLPSEWALFFASSMPIRDADTFLFHERALGPIFGNRGVSGIDGNIATAAGIAKGLERSILAVVGDQTFLHDINSLALVKKSKFPVVILVINNSGGGIFSFLPISEKKEFVEEYVAAAHTITFEKAAELFDLPYHFIKSEKELFSAMEQQQSCVIEVQTNRAENYRLHQEITQKLTEVSVS